MKVGDKVVLKKFESNEILDFTAYKSASIGEEVSVISIHADGTFEYGNGDWWIQSACESVKNERYFLFAYSTGSQTGNIFMSSEKMPSNDFLVNDTKERYGAKAVITNIFEFKSEQDYLDFTSNE